MLSLLRLLILWRLMRLLVPLAVCGLLLAVLAARPPADLHRAHPPTAFGMLGRDVQRAFGSELAKVRRDVTRGLMAPHAR